MISPTGKLNSLIRQPGTARCGRWQQAFTLIELILLMALLAIAISLVAPRLAGFFRGRALDSEARQLLALTRHGQSRAVSEGIPMRLWLDPKMKTYGLEADPSYTDWDSNAVQFSFGQAVEIEVELSQQVTANALARTDKRAGLPALSFLPDGTLGEGRTVTLRDQDGGALWLVQSRSRLNYELRNQTNLWNDARW